MKEREGCGLFKVTGQRFGRDEWIISLGLSAEWNYICPYPGWIYMLQDCTRWPATEPVPDAAAAELRRLGMTKEGWPVEMVLPDDVARFVDVTLSGHDPSRDRVRCAAKFLNSFPRREPEFKWIKYLDKFQNVSFRIAGHGVGLPSVSQLVIANAIMWRVWNMIDSFGGDVFFDTAEFAREAVERRLREEV